MVVNGKKYELDDFEFHENYTSILIRKRTT